MKLNKTFKLLIASFILFIILACNATFTSQFPTPTNIVLTETETATVMPSPISPTPQLSLSSVSIDEDSQAPSYQIKANVPTLQGTSEARVAEFNTAMTNLVNAEIDAFKKNVSQLPADTASTLSTYDVTYALMLQRDDLWSFKFDFAGYVAGAAHPYHYSKTVNYDLAQGRELALYELFLPNSNFLDIISQYSIEQLKKQPYSDSFSFDGAKPTPENYRNWNLTSDGLMITFDEYQVAPYAAGLQTVVVPYDELKTVINLQGPLGKIIQ